MNREEARSILKKCMTDMCEGEVKEAFDMAIEALKAKCPTCEWCSDHQESGTKCPIEEHYALPKDGFCHLYEPYRKEVSDEQRKRHQYD